MIKHYCDVCEVVIEPTKGYTVSVSSDDAKSSIDLCFNCYGNLKKLIDHYGRKS